MFLVLNLEYLLAIMTQVPGNEDPSFLDELVSTDMDFSIEDQAVCAYLIVTIVVYFMCICGFYV